MLNFCFYYYYRYCIIYPYEYPYVRILCLKRGEGGGSLKEVKRHKAGYCHPLGHRRFLNTTGGIKCWGCEHTGLMRRRRMQACRRLLLLRDCLVKLRGEWRDLERTSHKNCQSFCDLIIQCLVVSISEQKTTRAVLSNHFFSKKSAKRSKYRHAHVSCVLVHLLTLHLRQTQQTAYSYSITAYSITAYSI